MKVKNMSEVNKKPYPDYDLITRLLGKMRAYSITSLTTGETVDLINHLNEALFQEIKASRDEKAEAERCVAKNDSLRRLVRLDQAFRQACKNLCDATAEELPVGTVIDATLGRARIRGEVVSHSKGWSVHYAGSVMVRNSATGKIRRVTPNYEGHAMRIVSRPDGRKAG